MTRRKPQEMGRAIGLPEVTAPGMKTLQAVQLMLMDGVNPDGSMKTYLIKALLNYRSVGIQQIAEDLGRTDAVVDRVLRRERSTRYVQDAIAERLGLPPEMVWGRTSSQITLG